MKNIKNTNRKFSVQITEDGGQMLILDDKINGLFSGVSFYEDLGLTIHEKKELGIAFVDKLFAILSLRDLNNGFSDWNYKCEAFKDAYHIESVNKTNSKTTVSWLLTSILGISQDEAERRYDTAEDLINHPDFKDKEDIIVEKIYLSKKNL